MGRVLGQWEVDDALGGTYLADFLGVMNGCIIQHENRPRIGIAIHSTDNLLDDIDDLRLVVCVGLRLKIDMAIQAREADQSCDLPSAGGRDMVDGLASLSPHHAIGGASMVHGDFVAPDEIRWMAPEDVCIVYEDALRFGVCVDETSVSDLADAAKVAVHKPPRRCVRHVHFHHYVDQRTRGTGLGKRSKIAALLCREPREPLPWMSHPAGTKDVVHVHARDAELPSDRDFLDPACAHPKCFHAFGIGEFGHDICAGKDRC